MSKQSRIRPGEVRIIGGTWRRRRIPIPATAGLRPTPDRVRETLFNWLVPKLPGATCIDLYAGTGVLGFEALSRGAERVVFVERDTAAARAIEALAGELEANAEILCADAAEVLRRKGLGPFDLAFVDPPYALDVGPVLGALAASMPVGGQIYLERECGDEWPEASGIKWIRRGSAGAVDYGLAEVQ